MTLPLPAEPTGLSLNGEWRLGLDPVDVGEHQDWFKPGLVDEKWDPVTVPHCYSVDPRYHYYTGKAWYFRNFDHALAAEDERAFIRFEAVFYRAKVWLNGRLLGEHEGGYTPFEFDVTGLLADRNVLAVRVDNAWDTTTIPGAKTRVDYQSLNYGQLFPWMNYGGIIREVSLVVRPDVCLDKVRIEAVPDPASKTARLSIQACVRNRAPRPWDGSNAGVAVYLEGRKLTLEKLKVTVQEVEPHADAVLVIEAGLAGGDVKLWSFDAPVLYEAEVTAGRDVFRSSFGIRSIAVRGTKLLFNGDPVSLGGCNRPMDAPGHGSMDPPEVLEKDLRLIKSGGMELSRICHHPVSSRLLDWADRHGLLILAEAGNWQLTPEQMADPVIREKFRAQMREMIERDWNHPSVIGWSMGNEYQAQTEEGKAWTRDMCAFAKSLDPSRLVTFAGKTGAFDSGNGKPEDEAPQNVDFISVNIYGDYLETLRRIHALYPGKPVYVSEFGQRSDEAGNESEHAAHYHAAMEDFRQCDFLIGASVWTFNDYRSLFPGSNATGYRPWGLVSPDRTPRAAYEACRQEFAPAVMAVRQAGSGRVEVSITARKDFPSYPLRNYRLRAGEEVFDIPELAPGESRTFTISSNPDTAGNSIELEKPGGFVILKAGCPSGRPG